MTKRLSKEAESRLLTAAQQATELAEGGMHPNDAVVKAAMDNGVPAGHTELLAQAYNVAATRSQLSENDSLFAKAAEFPLADAAVIRGKIFPAAMAKAAAARVETAIDEDYNVPPPTFVRDRMKIAAAAAKPFDLAPPPVEGIRQVLPRSAEEEIKRASADRDRAQKRANDARALVAAAFDKYAGHVDALGAYFMQVGSESPTRVRANVLALHGKTAAAVIDAVAERLPLVAKGLDKSAAPVGLAVGKPYELVQSAIAACREYLKQAEALKEVGKEVQAAVYDAEVRMFGAPTDIVDGKVGMPLAGYSRKWAAAASSGAPGAPGAPAAPAPRSSTWWANPVDVIGQITKGFKGEPMKPYSRSPKGIDVDNFEMGSKALAEELSDPAHLADLHRVRSVGNFYNLLANDDVIRGHQPQAVASAFNDVAQLAPALAANRPAMQSLVRQRLSMPALDPFNVEQILKMQNVASGQPNRGGN